MIFYLILFFLPVLFSFYPINFSSSARNVFLFIFAMVFAMVIGLRDHIGGDWDTYQMYSDSLRDVNFYAALKTGDPGYFGLNWISVQLGAGVYGVNTICGIFFMVGLVCFSKQQPLPWVSIFVAIPYLMIVVVMGYTRQGAALGFVLLALSFLHNKNVLGFFSSVVAASLFHKSAFVIIPLVWFSFEEKNLRGYLVLIVFIILAFVGALMDYVTAQWQDYVDSQMQSDGGVVRVFLNLLPALILYFFRARFKAVSGQFYSLMVLLSVASVLCLPLVFFASTAVDRIALYLAPLQLMVYSRFPLLFKGGSRLGVMVLIVMLYAAVLYTWLQFSFYAHEFWLPYRSIFY